MRLAERLRCAGYVVLADRATKSIRFAANSPQWPYPWRRGSDIPNAHPIWKACGQSGAYRGEGPVNFSSGAKNFWLDAVADGPLVYAIFAEERYWAAPGIGILSGTVTKARGYALAGRCAHCGKSTWGYSPCDKCGDVRCRHCGRCGCGAEPTQLRTCEVCHLSKPPAQYRPGSSRCVDCE